MGEKSDRIQSLNQSETEVLHELFRDPTFKIKKYAESVYKSEQAIRGNLTAIYKKFGMPATVFNKREWVVKEYSEAYQEVFSGGPQIFIKPPDPIVVYPDIQEDSETSKPPSKDQHQNVFDRLLNRLSKQDVVIPVLILVFISVACGLLVQGVQGDYYKNQLATVQAQLATVQALPTPTAKIVTDKTVVQSKEINLEPSKNFIILSDQFDSQVPSENILGGPMIVSDGVATSSDGGSLTWGNADWVNYTIYARVIDYGCQLQPGEEIREVRIGVRKNSANVVFPAYSFNPCEVQTTTDYNITITVNGNMITGNVNGKDLEPKEIPQSSFDRGGIIIDLDKSTALDFILVAGMP